MKNMLNKLATLAVVAVTMGAPSLASASGTISRSWDNYDDNHHRNNNRYSYVNNNWNNDWDNNKKHNKRHKKHNRNRHSYVRYGDGFYGNQAYDFRNGEFFWCYEVNGSSRNNVKTYICYSAD